MVTTDSGFFSILFSTCRAGEPSRAESSRAELRFFGSDIFQKGGNEPNRAQLFCLGNVSKSQHLVTSRA